jgi:hypothetical protein
MCDVQKSLTKSYHGQRQSSLLLTSKIRSQLVFNFFSPFKRRNHVFYDETN